MLVDAGLKACSETSLPQLGTTRTLRLVFPWENRHAQTFRDRSPRGDARHLQSDASLAAATGAPEKTVPQGQDPPGADNGAQQTPALPEHKDVIPPPPIGDEDIYTEAPNPEAGH